MKSKKWNIIVYVQAFLFLWFLIFVGYLFFGTNDTKFSSILPFGLIFFWFVNIPLSVTSLVLNVKNFFSKKYKKVVTILSVLNILVGVAAWYFIIMLAQSPKFGG